MIHTVARYILPAAYALLPPRMASPEATALLLTIGLQESGFRHRRQIGGPARGFWQFEAGGGVIGVLTHPASREHLRRAAESLGYAASIPVDSAWVAIEHNDVLAAVFARLLLWTAPGPLPDLTDTSGAWRYYLHCWRPGKPHPETWLGHHRNATNLVQGTSSGPSGPLHA